MNESKYVNVNDSTLTKGENKCIKNEGQIKEDKQNSKSESKRFSGMLETANMQKVLHCMS